MSELKEILSPAQLIKHYELLQFLIKRANTAFTLAQLDYYLPHGAALQRFPLEWIAFVRRGGCAHRNIELHYRHSKHHSRRRSNTGGQGDVASKRRRTAEDDGGRADAKDDDDDSSSSSSSNSDSDSGDDWHAANTYNEDNNSDNDSNVAVADVLASPTTTTAAATAAAAAAARLRARVVLVCRQPVVRTLAELQQLLQTPSSLLDAEGCVALHTDQVIVTRELLSHAQRSGAAYFFSDRYTRAEATAATGLARRQRGVSMAPMASVVTAADKNKSSGSGSSGGGHAVALDTEGLRSGSAAVPSFVLRLPPGVRLRYRLCTLRGVVVRDELALPTRLHVDERVTVLLDNANAVALGGARAAAAGLHLTYQLNGIRLTGDDKDDDSGGNESSNNKSSSSSSTAATAATIVTAGGGVEESAMTATAAAAASGSGGSGAAAVAVPLRIRAKLVTLPASSSSNDSDSSTTTMSALRVTHVRLELEALREGRCVLLLDVNGCSNAIAMQTVAAPTAMPGVLIGRERQPTLLTLPPAYLLHDDIVTGATASTGADATATSTAAAAGLAGPLPWWQNASPLMRIVRDATYTLDADTVAAAMRTVYTASALAHEAAMQQSLQQRRAVAAAAAAVQSVGGMTGRQRRRRRATTRVAHELRNRHLLHYGIDLSLPLVRRTAANTTTTNNSSNNKDA